MHVRKFAFSLVFVLVLFFGLSFCSTAVAQQPNVGADKLNKSMKRATKFLRWQQHANGSFPRNRVSKYLLANTAVSGLAMLAAEGKPGEGEFGSALERAIGFVISQVQENGYIATDPKFGIMYEHAYALRFLAEAQMATPSDNAAAAIAKAVKLMLDCQNEQGGWRYVPEPRDSDCCVTSCVLIALIRARDSGAKVPQEAIDRAVTYITNCQLPDGGFSYIAGQPISSALGRSAAAVSALCLADAKPEVLENGFKYLDRNVLGMKLGEGYYYYTHFHLATAMQYASEKQFARWHKRTTDQLLKSQTAEGSWKRKGWDSTYVTGNVCCALLSRHRNAAKPNSSE